MCPAEEPAGVGQVFYNVMASAVSTAAFERVRRNGVKYWAKEISPSTTLFLGAEGDAIPGGIQPVLAQHVTIAKGIEPHMKQE